MSLCHGRPQAVNRFRLLLAPFLQSPGLPFAQVLREQDIQEAVEAEGIRFGRGEHDVYTPALVIWAFLSQVLHKGEARSCAAAVLRVITLLVALGRPPCSPDTGAYCRARAKLTEGMLRRPALTVAHRLEAHAPADWLWCGRHVKLVDGTTVSMPDTPANQQAYPQPSTQEPGLGFPLARMVVLFSLATAAMCGMALGRYQGKQTGETALLRHLLDQLEQGDVLLADRCYCSYFMLAMARQRGVDTVMRLHACRTNDLCRGRRLGRHDRLVRWTKPAQPSWMDDATYAAMPDTLTVRQVTASIHQPGFRVQTLVVVTTLTDPCRYPAARIGELYHARWHVELDLRTIKQSMGMDQLRCKSPQMVRKEIWAHWLAYNLIRKSAAQAALLHACGPRGVSYAGALQALQSAWTDLTTSTDLRLLELGRVHLRVIAHRKVGHRPGRVEPRAVKRRPKAQKLLTQPRAAARAALLEGTAGS